MSESRTRETWLYFFGFICSVGVFGFIIELLELDVGVRLSCGFDQSLASSAKATTMETQDVWVLERSECAHGKVG